MRDIPFGRPQIGAEERASVMDVLSGPTLVHGPVTTQFEHNFAELTGAPHAAPLSVLQNYAQIVSSQVRARGSAHLERPSPRLVLPRQFAAFQTGYLSQLSPEICGKYPNSGTRHSQFSNCEPLLQSRSIRPCNRIQTFHQRWDFHS